MAVSTNMLRASLSTPLILAIAGCVTLPGRTSHIVDARDARPAFAVTEQGAVQGARTYVGAVWLGIPFAAAPTGSLRFAPPRPAPAWSGTRTTVRLGDACPQGLPAGRRSEDCLNLNVFAPHDAAPDSRLPVMLWLYGGSLTFGANGQYDGSRLAESQRVIVVVPNYRMGAFGFMAHPALRGSGEGNYGILDQQAALRWVSRNIASFGGDPARVTLFGESAGATSACTQMAVPGSKGLFHRAILQSDTCIFPDQSTTQAEAERAGLAMAAKLGCADAATAAACLRAIPPKKLLEAKSGRWGNGGPDSWSPMTGGDVLPRSPRAVFAAGDAAAVPLMMGSNRDEGRLFSNILAITLTWTSRKGYQKAVARGIHPDVRAAAMREYADVARRSYYRAFADMVTDSHFACPMLTLHRLRGGRPADHVYEFNDPDAPTLVPDIPFTPRQKAFHAAELTYVFQQRLLFADPADWTPRQRALSDRMQRHWGAFAATGEPMVSDLPAWPTFDGVHPVSLAPDATGLVEDFAERHRCRFWNAHGY